METGLPMRQAVGGMMWLAAFTRPDIANAECAVARQAHACAGGTPLEGGEEDSRVPERDAGLRYHLPNKKGLVLGWGCLLTQAMLTRQPTGGR